MILIHFMLVFICVFAWLRFNENLNSKETQKKINLILGNYKKNTNISYYFFFFFLILFVIFAYNVEFYSYEYVFIKNIIMMMTIITYVLLLLSILFNNKNYYKIKFYGERLLKIFDEKIKVLESKVPYIGWKKIFILNILTVFMYHYYILTKLIIYSVNKKFYGNLYIRIILKIFAYLLLVFFILLQFSSIISKLYLNIEKFILSPEVSLIYNNILLIYFKGLFFAMILSLVWFLIYKIDKIFFKKTTIIIIIIYIYSLILSFHLSGNILDIIYDLLLSSVNYTFVFLTLILSYLSIYTFILSFIKLPSLTKD